MVIMKKRFERKYLPEFVFGGMDGSITTFAVVAGSIGASLSSLVVLALGFANLFADGFSMSVASYSSAKSRNEMLKNPEKNELKTGIATFLSFFAMGFIPLISFVLAALIKNSYLVSNQFTFSFVLTGLAFLIIGWYRGEVTGKHKLRTSIETFAIGEVAALLAFGVGYVVSILTGQV
jgi:VIT1/CCC1 family predicted Fe2+/Mn2+ transporter